MLSARDGGCYANTIILTSKQSVQIMAHHCSAHALLRHSYYHAGCSQRRHYSGSVELCGFTVNPFSPLPHGFGFADPSWGYAFTTTQRLASGFSEGTFDLCQDGTVSGDLVCNANKLVFTGEITGGWSSLGCITGLPAAAIACLTP